MFGNFNYQPCLPTCAACVCHQRKWQTEIKPKGTEMTKSYKNWLMLTTNPTTRIISPQCLMIQDHNESLVQHEEEKVHFPPKLFHPITQSHPELSAALGGAAVLHRDLQFLNTLLRYWCENNHLEGWQMCCAPKGKSDSQQMGWNLFFCLPESWSTVIFPPGILSCKRNFVLFATFLSEGDVFHKMPV